MWNINSKKHNTHKRRYKTYVWDSFLYIPVSLTTIFNTTVRVIWEENQNRRLKLIENVVE